MTNKIHDTAILGPGVELGFNNVIGPFSVISGPCRIGDDNWIGPNVVIGTPPDWEGKRHSISWEKGSSGLIEIGSGNTIREFSAIHSPSASCTSVGDGAYLMTRSYISHDVEISDGVKLAAGVLIGGFSKIAEKAYLGMGSIVHQRLYVGPGAMVGMGSVVTRHVPPLSKVYGNPARIRDLNSFRKSDFALSSTDFEIMVSSYLNSEIPRIELLSAEGRSIFEIFCGYHD